MNNHPVGIALAALLFGVLYQGGAELAFDMPKITREMVIVIIGLVILFSGALDRMLQPTLERMFSTVACAGGSLMDETFLLIVLTLDSTLRLAAPLILAALAGLFAERSGVIDIGLEGKMLAAAFASAATAVVMGSAWLGLLAGVVVSVLLALLHGFACITHRGNQVVSGLAINILVSGLPIILGVAWFQQGGQTPSLGADARFGRLRCHCGCAG